MTNKREKTGYALKAERGLVPHQYDKSSKRYEAGAWKNWEYPGGAERNPRQAAADRQLLAVQRGTRHG